MTAFELQILDLLQKLHTPVMDRIMIAFSNLGDMGIIWIALCLILLFFPKTRSAGKVVLLAMLLEVVGVNLFIKPLVARIRPYEINSTVDLITGEMKDYSFPSGHTAMAFTAVTGLCLMKMKPLWQICLVIALGIAFSRLYLYVHFPTDVAAGVILGIIFGWLGYRLERRIEQGRQTHSNHDNT